MMSNRTDVRAYTMLTAVMLFWAGNSIVGRAVRDSIPPFTLAFVRWAGALAVLLPFAIPHMRADRDTLIKHWRIVLTLGLIGVAGFNAFLYSGLRYTTATNALLIQAATPALVLIFDLLLFRTRASMAHVVGVIISSVGVLAIIFQGDLSRIASVHLGKGDALLLCGVTAWAIYTTLLRKRPEVHALSFLACTFLIAVLAMAPLAAAEWQQIQQIVWTPGVIGAFAYVAIFPSVIAYFLFNAAVKDIGAGRAGQTLTLMPLFGAFLAAAILGESLDTYHLVGMAAIMAGIAVTVLFRRRE